MSTLHLEVKQLELVLNKNLSNTLMNPWFLLNRIQSLVCHSQCSVLDSNLGFLRAFSHVASYCNPML